MDYADFIKLINPKEGYSLEYFNYHFPGIMDRARMILKSRTQDEIFAAAALIDAITHENSEKFLLKAITTIDEGGDFDLLPFSPAQKLAFFIEQSGVNESADFPNAALEEYFSVLALAIIGQAYEEQEYLKEIGHVSLDEVCWMKLGHYAIEAMEAVAYAESLIMQKRAELRAHQEEKDKRSKIAKAASESSHQKTKKLLKMLQTFYLKNNYSNYSTAVHDFLSVTDEKYYTHLAQTNRERTLREALSKVIRDIRIIE